MERAFFPILFESSVRKVFPTKKRQGAVAPPAADTPQST